MFNYLNTFSRLIGRSPAPDHSAIGPNPEADFSTSAATPGVLEADLDETHELPAAPIRRSRDRTLRVRARIARQALRALAAGEIEYDHFTKPNHLLAELQLLDYVSRHLSRGDMNEATDVLSRICPRYVAGRIAPEVHNCDGRTDWKQAFAVALRHATMPSTLTCIRSDVARLYLSRAEITQIATAVLPVLLREFIAQIGCPRVGSFHQALIYSLSASPRDRARGTKWFLSHPDRWTSFENLRERYPRMRHIANTEDVTISSILIRASIFRQELENHICFNKVMRNLPVKTPEDDAIRQRRRKRKARVLILPYLYGSQADLVN